MSITTLNGILDVVIEFHLGTSLTKNKSFESVLSLNAFAGLASVPGSAPATVSVSGHLRSKSEIEMVPYIKKLFVTDIAYTLQLPA